MAGNKKSSQLRIPFSGKDFHAHGAHGVINFVQSSFRIVPENVDTLRSRLPNKNYGTLGIHSLYPPPPPKKNSFKHAQNLPK